MKERTSLFFKVALLSLSAIQIMFGMFFVIVPIAFRVSDYDEFFVYCGLIPFLFGALGVWMLGVGLLGVYCVFWGSFLAMRVHFGLTAITFILQIIYGSYLLHNSFQSVHPLQQSFSKYFGTEYPNQYKLIKTLDSCKEAFNDECMNEIATKIHYITHFVLGTLLLVLSTLQVVVFLLSKWLCQNHTEEYFRTIFSIDELNGIMMGNKI